MSDTIYHVYVAQHGTAKRSAREMRYVGKCDDKESAMKMAYSELPTFREFRWEELTGEYFFDAPYGKASFLVSEGKYYAFVEERENEEESLYTIEPARRDLVQKMIEYEERIAKLEALIDANSEEDPPPVPPAKRGGGTSAGKKNN